MNLIDCHAHLNEFPDPGPVLRRAASVSVVGVVAVGIDTASSRRIIEISRQYPDTKIAPAIGLYPDEVTEDEIVSILELIDEYHPELAALGEIGLDYWVRGLRKKAPGREGVKALQQKAFRLQLRKAIRYSLVPIIHSRGAWADALRLVEEEGVKPAVFHWYTGPLEVLERIIAGGHFISATPAAAASPELRAVLAAAPLERIVLETDCPVPRRVGEERVPTEPADVVYSLRALAALKGFPEEEVARLTSRTARELFFPGTGRCRQLQPPAFRTE